jgi:hypothetical protein
LNYWSVDDPGGYLLFCLLVGDCDSDTSISLLKRFHRMKQLDYLSPAAFERRFYEQRLAA